MVYELERKGGRATFTIEADTINHDFSVGLVGQNQTAYGLDTAQNFLSLLENFASLDVEKPPNPVPGQLWYSLSDTTLYFNRASGDGGSTGWKKLISEDEFWDDTQFDSGYNYIDPGTGDIYDALLQLDQSIAAFSPGVNNFVELDDVTPNTLVNDKYLQVVAGKLALVDLPVVVIPAGGAGKVWGGDGPTEVILDIGASGSTAVAGENYWVDTTVNVVTIKLPLNPTRGDTVGFTDAVGNFNVNKFVVDRNGQLLMGLSQNMDNTTQFSSFRLAFSDAFGWRIVT